MVMNNEVNPKYLAERLRECAREMDHPRRRTFQSAADLIENQQTCIEALQKRLEMAQGERDIVTKHMIRQEQALAEASKELEEAEKCIDDIEDALERGTDNDWARNAISEYRKTMEAQ